MQTLKMDFQSQSAPPVVPVMQYDAQSRFIGITLYNGGVPYEAPEGASYTVQYRGPGANNMGWYNTITLSSGTRKAVIVDSASKNVVTLELAEQALRVNGNVFVNLCVVTNTGYMLHTFPIICRVTGAAFPDTVAVQSFFYVTGLTSVQWLAYVTACQDAQRRAEYAAAKLVIDPTLSLSGKAADAAKVGEAVGQIKEDKVDKPSTTDDGKIARAKAGEVEWVDVGQPTDAQTESAVTKWLDKHPEATTTVQDKSIDLKKLSNEAQSVIVGINSGIDSISYSNAIKKGYIDTFVCSENYKVYDFKNVTVKNLIVNCIFSTIKNVKVTVSFKIEDEARNCIFSNLRSEIPTESVTFGENTWAHKFIDCIFVGNGDTICFKQGYRKGDTLICNNCYYYNMFAIFKPDMNGFGIINGGWGDKIQYIIYADAFANGNYTIANYDFETINNVLYTSGKASNFDLNISGTISACKSIVFCDDQTNATVVNLIYNCNLLKNFKIFGSNYVFLYKSCNVLGDNLCNYPLNAINREITLEVSIPPKCYYEPFKSIIHLYSASWDDKYDGKINVYFGNDQYAKDSIYNGIKKFGILNKTEDFIRFAFTINTRNRLFSPI
nr:MAG TPA: BppU domain protein [Caudoviricetes sp.]